MSWMKRGQAGGVPGAQPYAAPQPPVQPFTNQQNMYPNYQSGSAPSQVQPPQQFWQPAPQPLPAPSQQQPQQYNQSLQYGQPYSQDYPVNANQYQPAPQAHYNQNYTNQYTNPQANYQQNFYQNQPQQNYALNPTNTGTGNADGWDDNWDWSWDENAKKAQGMQNAPQQLPAQQQLTNNANVIEESFASTDSWNWAMNEKKESETAAAAPPIQDKEPAEVQSDAVGHQAHPPLNNISNQQGEEVKTLSDREEIKERLPNLALGKRFHLENLTPQWSIESQMSQESSDGPHTLSEGTYRSDNQSRNSGESPGLNMDTSNYNYAQGGFDETYTQNSEWSKNSDEATVANVSNNLSRRESHEELSNTLQEMSLANDHQPQTVGYMEPHNIQDTMGNQPSPSISPANFPAPAPHHAPLSTAMMPPPPPMSALPPRLSSALVPPQQLPPNTTAASLPPTLPPPSNSQNPFQRAGPLSHKSINRSSAVPPPPFQHMSPSLASPAAVSKVAQSRGVLGFEANLETTPDNSERPDQTPVTPPVPPVAPPAAPDNLEVAPQHDRNQYLQTAHLSGPDYGENTDFTRTLPPPGLRRMVFGQQEPDYRSRNISGDEPPPGLARMVPGQHTEPDTAYDQPNGDYMHRHIDGQPTDSGASARPFRQADGYSQPPAERRPGPVPFDRMVPGEPSDDEYSQYQGPSYAANEQRVVTGLDRDYPLPAEAGPEDVREQNVDGSDYTERSPRSALGATDPTPDDCVQRELTVEGENLQDLSVISSADLTFSRERLDGAAPDAADTSAGADVPERPASGERKHSLNRLNTSGDDSERDRAFKSSPRRDRHKSSRDRDRDRNHDRDRDRDKDGRYSRGDRNDRKYDRDDRRRDDKRTDKERTSRGGDDSPDARKHRRSTRTRKYDDEDTDYYSDKERERRRYREGSYGTKPPRGEDRERRYNTIERERRDRPRDPPRDSTRRDRDRDRYDRHYADYRDIDPSRKYGNLHRERETERRRVTFSTDAKTNDSRSEGEASRAESRSAAGTDEEGAERRRRPRHHRADRHYHDGYGAGGGFQDPYLVQRQQYEYYEQLRLSDPAAYMLLYKQLMAGHAPQTPPRAHDPRAQHYAPHLGYSATLGYEAPDRGSVHSGRSSTTGLKGNDTWAAYPAEGAPCRSLQGAPSLRTDLSDRDLNTEASLGLQLEQSTVRSERMTPFRFSTAHVKASLGSRDIVLVPASYPVDGAPATVQLLSLAAARAADPAAADLAHAPGPLVKGVTHKKSVIEYCMVRVREAAREGAPDVLGYGLLWELLALMLRQNGVVVGSDIAELLMKNTREYPSEGAGARAGSVGSSAGSRAGSRSASPPPDPTNDYSLSETMGVDSPSSARVDESAALDKFREYLLYGNRQEALEWAMSNKLWGHALQLAASGERRLRASVAARFLAHIPRADPLHTLYAALAHLPPPAATCVSEEKWGEWRTHAAMLLANSTARPENDAKTLTTLGDSLASRGLWYSAQVCYVGGGVEWARHPLAPLQPGAGAGAGARGAPPRLTLLLADPRAATLHQLATTRAILATEIYEYARSLNKDYVINELQVYKLVMACRLVDAGQYERALAYVEAAARAVTRHPAAHARALVAALADLADRLKYHDPTLLAEGAALGAEEGADSAEGSPRHNQWLTDVTLLAHNLQTESQCAPETPQHYAWGGQALTQQYHQPVSQSYAAPEEAPAYCPAASPPAPAASAHADQYAPAPAPAPAPTDNEHALYADPSHTFISTEQKQAREGEPAYVRAEEAPYQYEDWSRTEETHSQSYAEPYWPADTPYGYGESGGAERPAISMPGSAAGAQHYSTYEDDRPPSAERGDDTSKSKESKSKDKDKEVKTDRAGRSWIGGILTKLSLRPPNQMILPDDKNPTIVWDADAKRWRNTDGTEEDPAGAPPPPPRSQDLPHATATTAANPSPPLAPGAALAPGAPLAPAAGVPPPPVSNIFKMQKGRHIKKSYVDVFNPRGVAERARPPAADVLGPSPPALGPAPAYFVPSTQDKSFRVLIPLSPLPSPDRSPHSTPSEEYEPSEGDIPDLDGVPGYMRSGI